MTTPLAIATATEQTLQPADADPRLGTTFEGRYRIESLLGKGGFGAVYRATQLRVGRPVALKILAARLATQPDELARFEQEGRVIAALDHPHIVKLVELGHSREGDAFLAMELLDGETLSQRVRREGALSERDVVTFGRHILEALAEAHAAGIIHRDLKSENLYLAHHPRRGTTVKLLDFGIAKVTGPGSGDAPRTRAGVVVGSPRVMAPEQICGDPVSPRTDLYAFGCVVYEMLTGRSPFVCRSAGAYARAHLNDRPAPPCREGQLVVGPLVELLMQCLEKRVDDRPASAAALLAVWPDAADVAPALVVTPAEPPPLPPQPSRSGVTETHRRRPRSRWPQRMAAVVIAASLGLALWSAQHTSRGRQIDCVALSTFISGGWVAGE